MTREQLTALENVGFAWVKRKGEALWNENYKTIYLLIKKYKEYRFVYNAGILLITIWSELSMYFSDCILLCELMKSSTRGMSIL
jgi:hypothetical protein